MLKFWLQKSQGSARKWFFQFSKNGENQIANTVSIGNISHFFGFGPFFNRYQSCSAAFVRRLSRSP